MDKIHTFHFKSIEKTQFAIYNACGLSPAQVQDVRPPNGFFTPKTLQLFQQWNYRPVMWSVVPEDWLHPGVNVVVNRVMNAKAFSYPNSQMSFV